ncbi:hypothetical protein DL98DRAFT_529831 [Cadophora sp. DSE1049]|nr:hypothetical protein DL98DRAFT_529831 [Cadophora sp. DSE1049]
MSSYAYAKTTPHSYESHQFVSQAGSHAQQRAPQGTYKFSYEQYKAAFPTYQQLCAGLGWDEAIQQNLMATQTQQKVSSGSTATTITTSSSSTRNSSETMASSVVEESAVTRPSIHTLLEGTTPLPRTMYDPDSTHRSSLKPIGFERSWGASASTN